MCIIFTCKTAVPSEPYLDEAQKRNDDGIGLAWITEVDDEKDKKKKIPMVAWDKDLSLEQLKEWLKENPAPTPDSPYIIHFRTASVGEALAELCHPFPMVDGAPVALSGLAPGVLFHNGTWHTWDDHLKAALYGGGGQKKMPFGAWSDSRAMALLSYWYGEGYLTFLRNSNRIATMVAGRMGVDKDGKKIPNPIWEWGNWVAGEEPGYRQSTTLSLPKSYGFNDRRVRKSDESSRARGGDLDDHPGAAATGAQPILGSGGFFVSDDERSGPEFSDYEITEMLIELTHEWDREGDVCKCFEGVV